MRNPMILVGQNQTALVPFPCNVYFKPYPGREDSERYHIICNDMIMADYSSKAAAKMETLRILDSYLNGDEKFYFLKEEK